MSDDNDSWNEDDKDIIPEVEEIPTGAKDTLNYRGWPSSQFKDNNETPVPDEPASKEAAPEDTAISDAKRTMIGMGAGGNTPSIISEHTTNEEPDGTASLLADVVEDDPICSDIEMPEPTDDRFRFEQENTGIHTAVKAIIPDEDKPTQVRSMSGIGEYDHITDEEPTTWGELAASGSAEPIDTSPPERITSNGSPLVQDSAPMTGVENPSDYDVNTPIKKLSERTTLPPEPIEKPNPKTTPEIDDNQPQPDDVPQTKDEPPAVVDEVSAEVEPPQGTGGSLGGSLPSVTPIYYTQTESVRLGVKKSIPKWIKSAIAAGLVLTVGFTAYAYKDEIKNGLDDTFVDGNKSIVASKSVEEKQVLEDVLSRKIINNTPYLSGSSAEQLPVPKPTPIPSLDSKPKPIQDKPLPRPKSLSKTTERNSVLSLDKLLKMSKCERWEYLSKTAGSEKAYSPFHKVPDYSNEKHIQNYINTLKFVARNEILKNRRLTEKYQSLDWSEKKAMVDDKIWDISYELGIDLNELRREYGSQKAFRLGLMDNKIKTKLCPSSSLSMWDDNESNEYDDETKIASPQPGQYRTFIAPNSNVEENSTDTIDDVTSTLAGIQSMFDEDDREEQLKKDMYCGESDEANALCNETLGVTAYEDGEPIKPIPLDPDPTYNQQLKKEKDAFLADSDLPAGWGDMYKQSENNILKNDIAEGETEQAMDLLYACLGIEPIFDENPQESRYEEKLQQERDNFLNSLPEGWDNAYEKAEENNNNNMMAKNETKEALCSLFECLGIETETEQPDISDRLAA